MGLNAERGRMVMSRLPATKLIGRGAMTLLLPLTTANAAEAKTKKDGQVTIVGTLADIAHNRLNGRIPISTSSNRSRLWALGMPTGLDRELLIENGRIMSGGFVDRRYILHHPADVEAAFLVETQVKAWVEIDIPRSVASFAELEHFVLQAGTARGLDGERPFPFRVAGKARHLKWFVVGGMGDLTPDPHASFARSRTLGSLSDVRIEALGFYSRHHRGVATNPNSDMHIHFRTLGLNPFVAHLDDEIELVPGGKLLLPL